MAIHLLYEEELDASIAQVMQELGVEGLTDYEKIKAIYDYVCKNVTYDYQHLNDVNYQLKYTAYAALINKTAVCQGYATLLYRMLLEAGLDSRIVAGATHAWNIVKLGDKYYYLDATWDSQRDIYGFFLRGTDDLDDNSYTKEHTLNGEYLSDEFQESYPMAEEKYSENAD